MKDSNHLVSRATQEIDRLSKTPQTTAGRTDTGNTRKKTASKEHIEVINQVFALFRINYHNQYYSAFSDDSILAAAKRLWLESLSRFEPETILRGAKRAIETCEYLPTLSKMIRCCEGEPSAHGLPDPHRAYVEACQAPSPKAGYRWSHPAVYYAGRESDWFFLANNPEKVAFPVFERNYRQLCARVIDGEQLPAPDVKALPETVETPLSKAENHKRLLELRKSLKL